jgi:endonuclease/exonuclease/phosphatase family metal-dependent hydrolase
MATPFRLEQDLIQVHQLRDVLRRPAELPRRAEITVASYNVYNLFGESAERPKPEEQLDALGEMVLKLNADIISFAEVEDVETLKNLFRSRVNNDLEGDDKYDAFICVPANDPRGINVAMATRLSVRGKMSFSDREFGSMEERATRFSRDLLGVKIQATPDADSSFLYFAGHLKSKIGGERAEEKRRMEAGEVINILTEPTFGDQPFMDQRLLFAGDMNDDPDSAVIDVLKDGGLDDLFAAVRPNDTYPTSLPRRRYPSTRLDYLFASAAMKPRVSRLQIRRDDPADEASDHYPISAAVRVV